ncbi:MAG: thiamine pyrophosphate-dependent enzyme [Bacillota bacterium]|jgi:pyruvate ferredoxin oxidoreductase beta subunit
MASFKDLPTEELLYGSFTCAGCGGTLAVRLALKVLGKETVIVTPPCCLMGVTTFYPQMAFDIPVVNSVMPGTGAMVSGLVAGLRRKGKEKATVLGLAGDGGTFDIGLQALSGAMERGEKFIFLCYDNEAYMNTGNQRSGATPFGAFSSTTPRGKERNKKDMLRIADAHNIPYVASACVSYPKDLMEKVAKAMEAPGPAYLQVLSPCPVGWGYNSEDTIDIGRLAVQTGLWVLAEYQQGDYRVTFKPSKRKPVADYLNRQDRFSLMTPEEMARIQTEVDNMWEKIKS